MVEYFALKTRRQILLGNPVVAVGMGVKVALSVAKTLRIAAGIFQMVRYLLCSFALYFGQGVEKTQAGIAFGCTCQIHRSMGQMVTTLGHTDPVEGRRRRLDYSQCMGIGKPDVF